MSVFEDAFAVVVGEEGSYGDDRNDPGNWTGGTVGSGDLRGTKYGISAAAFPDLDIEHLTLADAQAIYRRDYWSRVQGDKLPPPIALLVFDAAVNNGVDRAAQWLQAAVGVTKDGVVGPQTLLAVHLYEVSTVCIEMLAQRMVFMVALPTWPKFGLGWARRLAGLPWHAMALESV